MSYKPDRTQWMAYLYGELSPEETQRVEAYLAQHPEAQKELAALKATQSILGHWADEAVEPPMFMPEDTIASQEPSLWKQVFSPRFIQIVGGLAATLSLIFLLGAWSQFQVNYSEQGLQLGFGMASENPPNIPEKVVEPSPAPEKTATIDLKEVQKLVIAQTAQQRDSLHLRMTSLENRLLAQLHPTPTSPEPSQDTLFLQAQNLDMNWMLEQIREENLRMMLRLTELSQEQQEAYTNEVLTAFAEYLNEQRQRDLELIGLKFNDTEEQQLQTERILGELIARVTN